MQKTVSDKIEKIYPLSPLQEGLFFLKMKNESSAQYVVQNVIELEGKITSEIIVDAFKLLSLRYDVLRTIFHFNAKGRPVQIVLRNKYIECETKEMLGESQETIKKLCEEDVQRGFDFKKDTLMRATILHVEEDKFVILWTFHHIILDGWSLSLLENSFYSYLNSLIDGESFDSIKAKNEKERSSLPEYGHYIKWVQSTSPTAGEEYWKKYLSDYEEIADVKPYGGDAVSMDLQEIVEMETEQSLTDKITQAKEQLHITSSVLFETCWGILLQQVLNTEDAVFGKVVSGRNASLSGAEQIVGLFINTIPTRVDCRTNPKLSELLQTMNEDSMKSSDYDFIPLTTIQYCTKQGSELIKSIYTFENYFAQSVEEDSKVKLEVKASREQTNYNLSLLVYEDTAFHVRLMYNPALYSEQFANLIMKRYMDLVEKVVTNTDCSVRDIELASAQEQAMILRQFNETVVQVEPNETIITSFKNTVAKYGQKNAVVYLDREITYHQLDELSNQIANYLTENGVHREDYVGLICNRGVEMIAAMLGIIKAGAAYVPIDPTFPEERVKYILKDCKPALLLTTFEELSYPMKYENIKEILAQGNTEFQCVCSIQKHNLAYLIYTSGTTGIPKGVAVEHSGVVNLSKFFMESYNVTSDDNIIQFANYVFDASVWEITMALLTGATLVIPSEEFVKDVRKLESYCIESAVSVATMPPQFYVQTSNLKLRLLITAGSEANHQIMEKALSTGRYVNAYGPTETTVCATSFEADANCKDVIPIGKPIANTQVFIMKNNHLCGIGVPGELCVVGVGIARGYLNREDLTNEKFVDNPYGEGKMYRTGDLARWLPDGNIDFMGRIDNQVKIRGFRIEPGEIENTIRKQREVKDAAVTVVTLKNGEKVLAAYVVEEDSLDINKLKDEIRNYLPTYMVPDFIIKLDSIPVTRSGKLDKSMLPKVQVESQQEYVAPRTELEATLCECIQDVIKADKIGVYDNIFDYGATSLTVINIVLSAGKQGIQLTIQNLFDHPNVDSLSNYLESKNHKDYFIEAPEDYQKLNYLLENNKVGDQYTNSKNEIRDIVVTGATGFLGNHVLFQLIQKGFQAIYCVVRGKDTAECKERLQKNYVNFFGEEHAEDIDRIHILCGDFTNKEIEHTMPEHIDCVLHIAADTKHFGAKEEFYKTNVVGTENMLACAKRKNAQFIYVSTSSVCGNIFEDNEINEFSEQSFYVDQFFISPYMRTKFDAEKKVLEAYEQGLDSYIIRVGNLTNRMSDGKTMQNLKSNRFFNLLQGYIELGYYSERIENSDVEFSPIDQTAEGIVVLMRAHKKGETVYHLFNNKKVGMEQILNQLRKRGYQLEKVEEEVLEQKINDTLKDKKESEIYDQIKRTDVYDLEKPLKDLPLRSNFTDWILRNNGFIWNDIDDNYLEKVFTNWEMRYYIGEIK